MTSIGGVTLDRDMLWSDETNFTGIKGSVEPTIGGGVVIQEFTELEKGRKITLESTESSGFQRKSVVDQLIALARVLYASYTLVIQGGGNTITKTVRFRNEVDGGPVQFEPIVPITGVIPSTMYCKGIIYLMVV